MSDPSELCSRLANRHILTSMYAWTACLGSSALLQCLGSTNQSAAAPRQHQASNRASLLTAKAWRMACIIPQDVRPVLHWRALRH